MPGFSVHCVATISHRDFGQDCAAVASDVPINNRVVSKGTSGELQGEFSETESPWSFVSIDEPEGEITSRSARGCVARVGVTFAFHSLSGHLCCLLDSLTKREV